MGNLKQVATAGWMYIEEQTDGKHPDWTYLDEIDSDSGTGSNYAHYLVGGKVGNDARFNEISESDKPLNLYAAGKVWECYSDKGQTPDPDLGILDIPKQYDNAGSSYIWNLYAFLANAPYSLDPNGLNGKPIDVAVHLPEQTVMVADDNIKSWSGAWGTDLRYLFMWHDTKRHKSPAAFVDGHTDMIESEWDSYGPVPAYGDDWKFGRY